MDNPITHAEHEEFRRTIEAKFEVFEGEDRRQNRRIELLEKSVEKTSALTASVEKLAQSMQGMLKEQEKQGKRLETLEGRDGEMWRKVTGYIVTAVIGIVIGFIFTQIGF